MAEKIKISENELKQMIKEEYSKKITEIKLKNRLKAINEEIESLTKDEEKLDEVEAGAMKTHNAGTSQEYTKAEPKFTKKGSHLVEEDELEIELGDESNEDEEMTIDEILAKLASALEDKIEDAIDAKLGEDENAEEIVPSEEEVKEVPMEDETEEDKEEETTNLDESKPLVSESVKLRMQILSGVKRNTYND